MPVDEVRRRAAKFERTIRWRNRREYAAAVLVVILFGHLLLSRPNLLVRIGAASVMAAAIYVAHHMRRKAAAHVMPADLPLGESLQFHRNELERQRDLLRNVWSWYLLPFIPGFVLIAVGPLTTEPERWPRSAITLVIGAIAFLLIAWMNQREARKTQAYIDGLRIPAPAADLERSERNP